MNTNKLLFLLIGLFAFNGLLAQSMSDFTLKPSEEYDEHPEDYGMDFEEVKIEAEDDGKINLWLFKPREKSKRLMIISHDGRGNMGDDLAIVSKFVSLNYYVIIYDYRGYGASSEARVSKKFFTKAQFAEDLTSVLDYAKRQHASMLVSMYGRGIGAGIAIGCGSQNPRVGRIIADGAYPSHEHVEKRINVMDPSGEEEVKMPLGHDSKLMEPKFALEDDGGHLKGVMYIIGRQDPISNPTDMKDVIALKKKITSVYVVDESTGGLKNFKLNKDEYFSQMKSFLEGDVVDNRSKEEKK